MAEVVAVCISENKGERKKPVQSVELQVDHGIVGDAHAGDWHRQVSLLAQESINKMRAMGLDVTTGDFAENITTSGIELVSLPIGSRLQIGETLLEVTQIGKECHTRCAIFHQAGDCVMPKEGIFAKVIRPGSIKPGDGIEAVAAPIKVEWRHYDKAGATCDRCGDTGSNLKQVIGEYAGQGVVIELQETLLTEEQISESNMVLINGLPLEELLTATTGESSCPSCSCLTGSETSCRTVQCGGEVYEELTPELIRKGIEAVLS
jgi:MOSC domain-containing protein YiiM